jgi:tRNA A-37 threonylcarbamoyl transferase component Bud32
MLSDLEAIGYSIRKEDNLTLIYKPALSGLWNPAKTKGPMGETTTLTGRSPLRFIEPDMVVRTLMHGGVFRHITAKRFLSPNRTIRELKVSAYLAAHGLRTPEILAVRLIKAGLFYSIDVVSKFIPDSKDLLVHFEKGHTDSLELIKKSGSLIRQIHDLGVYHTDLHIKNLLMENSGNLWVLDLDKAYQFALLPEFMKQMNLKRFMRSIIKWQTKGRIHLPDKWASSFLDGYHSNSSAIFG